MTTQTIETKVKELKELQRMSEELTAEMESIKNELKQEIISRGTGEIITTEYKLRYKEVNGSRFDTTAFKAKYAELYNQFVKSTSQMRFTVA